MDVLLWFVAPLGLVALIAVVLIGTTRSNDRPPTGIEGGPSWPA